MGEGVTRRVVLRDGSALAVAVLLSGPASGLADIAVPVRKGRAAFLNNKEMEALRGLVDHFIPADSDPGALAAGCAEAIDALLGAFKTEPPRIYAGAPFSDRGGSKVNHFKRFLRLDPYEEMGWRLRIQGSRGRKRLEFNGPVKGWQPIYREGLAALDEAAGGSFGDRSTLERELILRGGGEAITDLVDVAFPHTLHFMYGAPEYGGNKMLAGWSYTNYDGDVQPRGYTRKQIEEPDPSGSRSLLGLDELRTPLRDLVALAPLASPDAAHGISARSGDSLAAIREEIAAVIRWSRNGGLNGP